MPGERTREPAAPRTRRRLPAAATDRRTGSATDLFTTRPPIRHMTITDRMTAAHHP